MLPNKAKTQEINDAWEKAQQRRDKQREIREEEYWNKYYACKAFAHQEQVANLYYNSVLVADANDVTYTDGLESTIGIL